MIGGLLALALLCAPGTPGAHPEPAPAAREDTLRLDPARSVIRWKGTKFRGRGSHEGTVRLAGGYLLADGGNVRGGAFRIDMHAIEVTDIPESDPIPRRRLRDHLRSDHFFATEHYPAADFRLRSVTPSGPVHYDVVGDLTLRGQTHPVRFAARAVPLPGGGLRATAQLAIDRQRWGVAYRGTSLGELAVDDTVHLGLNLVFGR
ncbi:MAG TPA: YceI family protein [Longimicrobium sp.]|jgi:polyisoprenoid-binding protein YceI